MGPLCAQNLTVRHCVCSKRGMKVKRKLSAQDLGAIAKIDPIRREFIRLIIVFLLTVGPAGLEPATDGL